jgi:hypothetical protein
LSQIYEFGVIGPLVVLAKPTDFLTRFTGVYLGHVPSYYTKIYNVAGVRAMYFRKSVEVSVEKN